MIPQRNAQLVSVLGPGGTEEYRRDPGSGASKWEGKAPAYYQEKREKVQGAGGTDVIVRRTLVVENDIPPVLYDNDDVLLFRLGKRVDLITAVVGAVERREKPDALGIPNGVATTRITFKDA